MLSVLIFLTQNVAEQKVHSVLISTSTYLIINFSPKLLLAQKLYIRIVPNYPIIYYELPPNSKYPDATSLSLKNSDPILTDTQLCKDTEPNCERLIAHAVEVKFVNNCYTTLVIIEFDSSNSESTVNIPVKYCKIFAAIKLLDPSATITVGENL